MCRPQNATEFVLRGGSLCTINIFEFFYFFYFYTNVNATNACLQTIFFPVNRVPLETPTSRFRKGTRTVKSLRIHLAVGEHSSSGISVSIIQHIRIPCNFTNKKPTSFPKSYTIRQRRVVTHGFRSAKMDFFSRLPGLSRWVDGGHLRAQFRGRFKRC